MTRTGERHIVGRTVAWLDKLLDADTRIIIADHIIATFCTVQHHARVRLDERQNAVL